MDKISVIMPAYNVEKYIRKTFESLINQTYKNLEIIVINDGSTDNTADIIEEYAAKDSRIKAIHKQNDGVAVARNVGLSNATGDYIAFADSDDILNLKAYEILYNLLQKYDADISFAKLTRFYENDEIKLESYEKQDREITKNEAYKMILLDKDIGNYITIKMFKRELFDKIQFPNYCAYEDVSTLYKVVNKANKIAYTNETIYYYRVGRDGAITSNFSEKKIKDSMNAYYFQYKFLIDNYPDITKYASLIYAKMYTSALEKMCINKFWELYDSENVEIKYETFKEAVKNIDDDIMLQNLENYRIISITTLAESKKLYREMFKSIYEIKQKELIHT